jgi:predicted TIM-barrel fold metal-dependent hydrolase
MIIDFHTHIFPSFFRDNERAFFAAEPAFERLYGSSRSRLVDREDLLRSMDEAGVHKSVILGFPWEDPDHYRRHNDHIIESVQRYPDRLIGLCCFSPLSPQAPGEAERCLASGSSGVGELAVYSSDPSAEPMYASAEIMRLCERFDVPVLVHTNEPVGHDYPGKNPTTLAQIYRFLNAYPQNKIVLAHWGGGLFFYALMKREVKEVLHNVWFDTAASPYLYEERIYRLAVEILGDDQIVMGSDYPLLSPSRYLAEMTAADLPERSFKKIAGENAARLLGVARS